MTSERLNDLIRAINQQRQFASHLSLADKYYQCSQAFRDEHPDFWELVDDTVMDEEVKNRCQAANQDHPTKMKPAFDFNRWDGPNTYVHTGKTK